MSVSGGYLDLEEDFNPFSKNELGLDTDTREEVVWTNSALPQTAGAIKEVNHLNHGPWKRSCQYKETEGQFSPIKQERDAKSKLSDKIDTSSNANGEIEYVAGRGNKLEDFKEEDFSLPLEELPDGRLSHHEECMINSQQNRIDRAKFSLKNQTVYTSRLENANRKRMTVDAKYSLAKTYKAGQSINIAHDPAIGVENCSGILKSRRDRILLEGKDALDIIKNYVGKDMRKSEETAKMTVEDFGEESTIEFPKLGTIEEKIQDLRQEEYEVYCKKHGRTAAARFRNKDKRMLRKWFNELDRDGSGEVSVMELQDPMLSAGIFKTREQIFRVMLNADKNETMGLDFEEFLNALYNSKNDLIDVRKLKKLQEMGADRHGFDMETLITQERRAKLFNSTVNQSEKRAAQYQKESENLTRAGHNLELWKYEQRIRQEAAEKRASLSREGGGGRRMASIYTICKAHDKSYKAPAEKAYARAVKDITKLEVQQGEEKKLHKQYLDSLEVVLKQKRGQEDAYLGQQMGTFRQQLGGKESEIGSDSTTGSAFSSGTSSAYVPIRNSSVVQAMLKPVVPLESFGGQGQGHSNITTADKLMNTNSNLSSMAAHTNRRFQMKEKNCYNSYTRSGFSESMYGKDTRRIFMKSLDIPT